jgi:hypothetical protein
MPCFSLSVTARMYGPMSRLLPIDGTASHGMRTGQCVSRQQGVT